MPQSLYLVASHPDAPEARPLIDALSADLDTRFGSDGRASFQDWQPHDPKHVFLLVCNDDEAVGCGAVRPISDSIGEVKRMYAKYPGQGIGRAVLAGLEAAAWQAGYAELWLETRTSNTEACSFYQKRGYRRIPNYGRYVGREEAACFGRYLGPVPAATSQPELQSTLGNF
ncbi:GNAT family N-acetyltransferase [Hymenobacter koreensis]|uniref:GNAT family N-acetyltransferase n=1 Tax=Hymenobacter koreensis TaxID=1084523 RepID=A0ABP8JM70_9BACT